MKKRIATIVIALTVMIGGGIAMLVSTNEASACSRCDTRYSSRKCGSCGSNRLLGHPSMKSYYKDGYLYMFFQCRDCGHEAMRKERH